MKNLSSQGTNENKHLYPHTTEVNRPYPLQTHNKTFARTTELTSKHVLVLHVLTRTPFHTLLQIQNILSQNKFTKTKD